VPERFHFLASQGQKEAVSLPFAFRLHRAQGNEPAGLHRCLCGHQRIGLKELCDGFRAQHDDYNAIMAEAIADRLGEAFASAESGSDDGATVAGSPRHRRSIHEKYRRHSVGRGYPRVRSHGEGHAVASARCAGDISGLALITENRFCHDGPDRAWSGYYFAHPESALLSSLGKIDAAISVSTMPERTRG